MSKSLSDILSSTSNEEVCNYLFEYLKAKKRSKLGEDFMSPHTYICWRVTDKVGNVQKAYAYNETVVEGGVGYGRH